MSLNLFYIDLRNKFRSQIFFFPVMLGLLSTLFFLFGSRPEPRTPLKP